MVEFLKRCCGSMLRITSLSRSRFPSCAAHAGMQHAARIRVQDTSSATRLANHANMTRSERVGARTRRKQGKARARQMQSRACTAWATALMGDW